MVPKTMLEIGVNDGITAKGLLENIPSIREYIGVDVPMEYQTELAMQRNEVPVRPGHLVNDERFRLLVYPQGSLDLSPGDLPQCDVVFIDGDHGRKAVMHDSDLADKVIRPGGMIIWHDYHDMGNVDVREVLHERAAAGEAITNVEGTWLAFRIKPKGDN
jgi:predicted O-methyltransferase YrrM